MLAKIQLENITLDCQEMYFFKDLPKQTNLIKVQKFANCKQRKFIDSYGARIP